MGNFRLTYPQQTAPGGTHPGFRVGPSRTLWHHNGFGPGEHYTLEVNPANPAQMIVEPGETTVVSYYAPDNVDGWTAVEIAEAETIRRGTLVQASSITSTWIMSTTPVTGNVVGYGLRSDLPLAWEVAGVADIGRKHYQARHPGGTTVRIAEWSLFLRGGSYGNQPFGTTPGESPLHPRRWGAFGTGPRPRWTRSQGHNMGAGTFNLAFTEMEFTQNFTYKADGDALLWADCALTSPSDALTADSFLRTGMTLYGTAIMDCTPPSPRDGGPDWLSPRDNRSSGTFMSRQKGLLRWRCFWDRNGFHPSYNMDGVTYIPGVYLQPPSMFNHHNYDAEDSWDTTNLECVYARAPFDSVQGRAGIYMNLNIEIENPHGDLFGDGAGIVFGNFPGFVGTFPWKDGANNNWVRGLTSNNRYEVVAGDSTSFAIKSGYPGDPRYGYDMFAPGETLLFERDGTTTVVWTSYDAHLIEITGNLNYVNRVLVMGSSRQRVDHGDPGQRGAGLSGAPSNGNQGTYKNIIIANAIDPQNAVEETNNPDPRYIKNQVGYSYEPRASGLTNKGIERWGKAHRFHAIVFNWGASTFDENVPPVPKTNRDRVTIGAWADAKQGVALGTNDPNSAADYIRTRPDRCLLAVDIWNYAQTLLGLPTIGHAPGAMARFSPDPDGDGWRTDSPDSWLINGVRGDWPVDGDDCDLDGQLASWYRTCRFDDMDFGLGGGWRMTGGYISCNTTQGNGTLDLKGAGQFWLTTSSVDIDVNATGGRLGIKGVVSQIRGSFSGRAELLIDQGGSLTISAGDQVTLNGDLVKAGFDGQGGVAQLTVAGTLSLQPVAGKLPKIREFRSGKYGLETPAAGVTGQPKNPNVTSNIVLATGGTLLVGTTGVTFPVDLMEADTITVQAGFTLPSNTSVVPVGPRQVLRKTA